MYEITGKGISMGFVDNENQCGKAFGYDEIIWSRRLSQK